MSSGPALGGDKPNDVRNSQSAFTGWQHLQFALGRSLPNAIKTAKREAQAIKRGRR